MNSSLFLFYLFCNFNSILSTNKVVFVVVVGGGGGGGALDKPFSSRIWAEGRKNSSKKDIHKTVERKIEKMHTEQMENTLRLT